MQDTAKQILENLIAAWKNASDSRDLQKLLALMAEDAVFLAPGAPPICGKEAVESMFRTVWQRVQRHTQNFVIREAWISGDTLIAWGEDSAAMFTQDASEPIRYAGHGMMILKQEADGWKFARGINNMMVLKQQ